MRPQLTVLIGQHAHYATLEFAMQLNAFRLPEQLRLMGDQQGTPSEMSLRALCRTLEDMRGNVIIDGLEANLTPTDQVRAVEAVLAALRPNREIFISTNALMVIYVLNNRLLDDKLEPSIIEVYDMRTQQRKFVPVENQIDESLVGDVYDSMGAELNRIYAKRGPRD